MLNMETCKSSQQSSLLGKGIDRDLSADNKCQMSGQLLAEYLMTDESVFFVRLPW